MPLPQRRRVAAWVPRVLDPAAVRSAVAEGCVLCAERLLASGSSDEAARLYDKIRAADVSRQRIVEATRGAILARGSAGVPLLVEQLRAEDNDLVVKGNLISRIHAKVELRRGKFFLVDQSTNGTFLQNVQGEETFVRRDSAELHDEGTIGLGRAEEPGGNLAIHFKALD